jgi:hypothetical protein
MPNRKLKREHARRMSRKFWIALSVGTLILLILTLIDLHYMNLTYIEPR